MTIDLGPPGDIDSYQILRSASADMSAPTTFTQELSIVSTFNDTPTRGQGTTLSRRSGTVW